MDTVRRQEQMPSINANEQLRTDTLLKQKMCSSKKHNHVSSSNGMTFENLRKATLTNNQHYQNGDFLLEKPRVYTHDDRNFSGANILSSSSASSTLSVKNHKDNTETRYQRFALNRRRRRRRPSMCFASRFFSLMKTFRFRHCCAVFPGRFPHKTDVMLLVVLVESWIFMEEN